MASQPHGRPQRATRQRGCGCVVYRQAGARPERCPRIACPILPSPMNPMFHAIPFLRGYGPPVMGEVLLAQEGHSKQRLYNRMHMAFCELTVPSLPFSCVFPPRTRQRAPSTCSTVYVLPYAGTATARLPTRGGPVHVPLAGHPPRPDAAVASRGLYSRHSLSL